MQCSEIILKFVGSMSFNVGFGFRVQRKFTNNYMIILNLSPEPLRVQEAALGIAYGVYPSSQLSSSTIAANSAVTQLTDHSTHSAPKPRISPLPPANSAPQCAYLRSTSLYQLARYGDAPQAGTEIQQGRDGVRGAAVDGFGAGEAARVATLGSRLGWVLIGARGGGWCVGSRLEAVRGRWVVGFGDMGEEGRGRFLVGGVVCVGVIVVVRWVKWRYFRRL